MEGRKVRDCIVFLIRLHMGRVYPYAFKDYELKSLLHYAIKGYNLVPGVPVPQPKSAV